MNSITDGEVNRAEEIRGITDLEKLKKTFDEIGQEYFIKTATHGEAFISREFQYDLVVAIDSGRGFAGMVGEFYFLNGKRVGHGVWE